MQEIYFGSDVRAHRRAMDIFYIVSCGLCLVFVLLSFTKLGAGMRFFPLIFLDAAILNLVSAYSRFHSKDSRYRRTGSGMAMVVLGVLMLVVTYISGICIWG